MNMSSSNTEILRKPESIVKNENSVAIAIDMGCEFTKVSYWNFEDNCSNIIKIDNTESIPTAIAYSSRNSYVVGKSAIKQLQIAPKEVILHFPMLLLEENEEKALSAIRKMSVSEIIRDEKGDPQWHIISNNESIKLSLKDIVCDFLSYIISCVSNQLEKSISTIFMINSSSSSNCLFFQEVSSSLHTPIELIASSTSMCLSYGFFEEHVSKQLLLIDFSWNSVKLTVVQHHNNHLLLGPSSTCSDLCGYSISSGLYDSLFSRISPAYHDVLSNDYITKNKILMNVYNCLNHTKKLLNLSKRESTIQQDRNVSFTITSKFFQHYMNDQIQKLDQSINQFLNNHSLSIDSFDDVLISGGLANCNYVYNYIQEKFPNCYFPELITIYNLHNNANETVQVTGAAIQCGYWEGLSINDIHSLLLIDLLPHDIYIKNGEDYEVVIPKNSSIPTRKTVEFVVEDSDEELSVEIFRKKANEDEFMSLGSFDFQLDRKEMKDSNTVGVFFTIGHNGAISAQCSCNYEPEVNTTNVLLLLMALVFLVIMYVFLKIYFKDSR